LRIFEHQPVELRRPSQREIAARSEAGLEIGPHVLHGHEVIVVGKKKAKVESLGVTLPRHRGRQGWSASTGGTKLIVVARFPGLAAAERLRHDTLHPKKMGLEIRAKLRARLKGEPAWAREEVVTTSPFM
jgi:hypothetical protein